MSLSPVGLLYEKVGMLFGKIELKP